MMIMNSKKAQVQMTETIAILFIFFILVGLGISFYAKYRVVALDDQREELLQARAVRTTLKALFLPEILCSRGSAEPEENCVDVLKAKNFQKVLGEYSNDYYFEMFSYANISLFGIYPLSEKIVIYENSKLDHENTEKTYFIVTLRDETAGVSGVPAYGYGYMVVEVYS